MVWTPELLYMHNIIGCLVYSLFAVPILKIVLNIFHKRTTKHPEGNSKEKLVINEVLKGTMNLLMWTIFAFSLLTLTEYIFIKLM